MSIKGEFKISRKSHKDGFLLAESKASKNEVEAALNDARKLKFQNAKVTLLLGSSLLALTACGGGGAGLFGGCIIPHPPKHIIFFSPIFFQDLLTLM